MRRVRLCFSLSPSSITFQNVVRSAFPMVDTLLVEKTVCRVGDSVGVGVAGFEVAAEEVFFLFVSSEVDSTSRRVRAMICFLPSWFAAV